MLLQLYEKTFHCSGRPILPEKVDNSAPGTTESSATSCHPEEDADYKDSYILSQKSDNTDETDIKTETVDREPCDTDTKSQNFKDAAASSSQKINVTSKSSGKAEANYQECKEVSY